jgi:hypothetical protein
MNIPAPGGSVGPKGFLVYVAGGTLGAALYFHVLSNYVPDGWESASFGPLNGAQAFIAASVLIGAALASKAL